MIAVRLMTPAANQAVPEPTSRSDGGRPLPQGTLVMRSFADPSLFRVLHSLVDEAGVDLRRTAWSHRDVDWARQRHAFSSSDTSFTIDRVVVSKPGVQKWKLLYVTEAWWDGDDKPIRSTQWAKPLSGPRDKVLAWLKAEHRRINHLHDRQDLATQV